MDVSSKPAWKTGDRGAVLIELGITVPVLLLLSAYLLTLGSGLRQAAVAGHAGFIGALAAWAESAEFGEQRTRLVAGLQSIPLSALDVEASLPEIRSGSPGWVVTLEVRGESHLPFRVQPVSVRVAAPLIAPSLASASSPANGLYRRYCITSSGSLIAVEQPNPCPEAETFSVGAEDSLIIEGLDLE